MHLEKAKNEDCNLLFNWANDSIVRANSFDCNKINYEDHVKWFNNRLSSNNSIIYICYYDDEPVGQVRIELQNEDYLISYSIDNSCRGKGYGEKMLKLLEKEVRTLHGNAKGLIGYVKHSNIPSQKVFQKLGYTESFQENFIRYYKELNKEV